MLQAEIGSARLTPDGSLPKRGLLMRDFTLPSAEGGQVSLYDYRGRANLALLFAGDSEQPAKALLAELTRRYAEIRDQDAEILLVVAGSREQAKQLKQQSGLPFPVLADEDKHVHCAVGAVRAKGAAAAAVYLTDRFFEVYSLWRTGEGQSLPEAAEVVKRLAYIDSECPECTQIEWPKD